MSLVWEAETKLLHACFFEVQNALGPGLEEACCQRACELWLEHRGVPYVPHMACPLTVMDSAATVLIPDLVVWDKITVELKAVRRHLRDEELVQLFDYLKKRGDAVGILANFGLARVETRRIVHASHALPAAHHCHWTAWDGFHDSNVHILTARIREAVEHLLSTHGTGYGSEVTEKLVAASLAAHGVSQTLSPVVTCHFDSHQLGASRLPCRVLGHTVVLVFSALFADNSHNVAMVRSFAKSLGLPLGLAINFGRHDIELEAMAF